MFRATSAILVSLLLATASAPVQAEDAAHLVATRSARTPQGATRVVFETDRPVEYLSVEHPSGDGYTIHLMDVDGTALPAPLSPKGALITRVSFRGSANGVVAELDGANGPLKVHAFTLANPPRIVIDLRPDTERVSAPAPKRSPHVAESVPARKPAATKADAPAKGTEHAAAPPQGKDRTIFEETEADEIAARQRAVPEENDFEDLLVWLHALQNSVEALNVSDNETDRARYRRRLGYLLVQRGILVEGEKALLSAVQGKGADSTTAVADSVALAEVRVEMGERESASEIARAIDTARAKPSERVRLAEVLLDTGQATLAANLLDRTMDSLTGVLHSEGTFLMARAYHATGRNAQARDTVRKLTSHAATPKWMMPEALLLHADCEFALGRAREAEALYTRAAAMELPDEDASWAALQLGNLARRDGRDEEARRRWQSTAEQWPDTFFASQAAWFLRVAETVRRVNDAEAGNSRG
ncbi:hypothetical protein K8I85_04205 [bacterium]|nr:hypothetical protein [bacterium]